MKTSIIAAVVGVCLLVAAALYFYKYHWNTPPSSHWDIVPTNALVVYQRDDCTECVAQLQASPMWKIIEAATFYNKGLDSLRAFLFRTLPKARDISVSVHATKKDEFDFVFYATGLPQSGAELEALFSKNQRHTSRVFSEHEIHETGSPKEFLSWTIIGETWIGSFTPFLVEDVVRTATRDTGLSQAAMITKISDAESGGNLFVQLDRFPDVLALFSSSEQTRYPFAKSATLSIKSHEDDIVLNGFDSDTSSQQSFLLSIFKQQSPVSFDLKNLITSNTIAVQAFGVSDGASFDKDLSAFATRYYPRQRDSLKITGRSAKVDFSELYTSIADEIGICYVESRVRNRFSKVVLVETTDKKTWLSAFNKLAETYSIDTIFYEQYSDYNIGEIPIFRFTEKLFAPLVTGFDQTFYTSINNTIVLADNLDDLKKFLDYLDEDETWGKSVSYNKFLETTLLESNVSIFINTPRVWNLLSTQLHPRWRQFVKEHESLLRSIRLSAVQFSKVNNGFYTNVSINTSRVTDRKSVSEKQRSETRFEAPIRNLYAVKSHVDRRDEILVQDSVNDLSLINNEGTVQWKIPIGDVITSEVTQVDFFANGKLQYFFTTVTGMHVVDRLGHYVEPFPILLSAIELEHGVVVDYDHSRKYRFMVADKNGRIWMYDKDGNNLEGWQPKDIGGPLAFAPRHHRINGKDYIIAIRRDGKIFIMNRRGETLKNFPVDLEGKPLGEYFLETEGSNDHFVVVTDDGYKIRMTPEGKILSREALLKSSVSTKFSLVSEKTMKSYILVQQDTRGVTILDQDGKKILTNETIGANPVMVRLYDFGGGKSYISITDQAQGYTFLHDSGGAMLNDVPIESTILALRPKDSDENVAFFVQGQMLTITPVKR